MKTVVVRWRCPICKVRVRLAPEDFPVFCCGVSHQCPSELVSSISYKAQRPSRDPVHNPCSYRKEELRTETCPTCVGHVEVKIFGCDLYKECTLIKPLPEKACCYFCTSYTTPARFVTTSDLARDTLLLANVLPPKIKGIAGIPRSGMIPATILSTHLHLPLFSLDHRGLHDMSCGWRLSDSVYKDREGPLIVVDDTSMYGGSLFGAKEWWKQYGNGTDVLWATVYCSPRKHHTRGPLPDVWAVDLHDPHLLEWNFVNSGFARRMALDFDGVLTVDGTEKPLYIPRKYPIPLIITGRFESERERSEAWLIRHGAVFEKLVMFQGSREDRDKPQVIGKFKAEVFAGSGLDTFVESDPVQAKEIAELTKKRVICPTIAKVF